MPTPQEKAFAADMEDLLSCFGEVKTRFMFGGYGVYHQGLIFGLLDSGVLYLKADELTKPDFEARGCGPFVWVRPSDGAEMPMGYYRVPLEVLEHPPTLAQWAAKAFEVALRAKAAPKKKSSKKGAKKTSPDETSA